MNSAENDAQLIADYIRVQESGGMWTLEVAIIEWPHPHTPEPRWTEVKQYQRPLSPEQLTAAQHRLLTNSRFFRMCTHCNERHNAGHMYNRKMCYGCAERELQVVF
jgi:hypothetical protein